MNTYHYLRIPHHQDHLCITIFRYYLLRSFVLLFFVTIYLYPFLLCVVMNKHFSISFSIYLGSKFVEGSGVSADLQAKVCKGRALLSRYCHIWASPLKIRLNISSSLMHSQLWTMASSVATTLDRM